MTGSLSCVWNDFPCYVVKNRKTNIGPQWLWGLEAGVLEKLESVVVLHTRSWSSVVQWWLLLVPKIVKEVICQATYPYHSLSIWVCLQIQYSQFQWIMNDWLSQSSWKKTCFSIFSLRRDRFPQERRWWSSLWDSRFGSRSTWKCWEPPKSSQVCISFPIQKLGSS